MHNVSEAERINKLNEKHLCETEELNKKHQREMEEKERLFNKNTDILNGKVES